MASVYVQAKGKLVYRGLHCTVHYDPDRKSMARLAVSPVLAGELMKLARGAKTFAVAISPSSKGKSRRGDAPKVHYKDAFILVPGTVHDIGHPPMIRAAVRLINMSPQAKIVEVGTSTSPKYEVLKKTLDHLNGANPVRQ